MTKTDTIIIDKAILERAMLETVYWWVDCEYDYYNLFSKSVLAGEVSQKMFYAFTKKYTVRRTLRSGDDDVDGQDATNRLLVYLNSKNFYKEVKKDSNDIIDQTDHSHEGKSIRSLLSKYATLINPTAYTMYDTMARIGLQAFGGKSSYNDYQTFYNLFTNFERKFLKGVNTDDMEYYISICNRHDKPIKQETFKRRLADKFLWCYASHLRDK